MVYPVYMKQFIDDPGIKILYIKDPEESATRLIPARYAKTSNFTEYKGHLYDKNGKEVIFDDGIENIIRCFGETPVYGRGNAVFLVTLSGGLGKESLACTIEDSNSVTHLVIHPECKDASLDFYLSAISLKTFFGEGTCLETWLGEDRMDSIFIVERPNPTDYEIFDAKFNSLIPAEIYQDAESDIPLHKGLYIFDRNPFIDEEQRFTVCLFYEDRYRELHTDTAFLARRLETLKPQEIPHYIPFYLTT